MIEKVKDILFGQMKQFGFEKNAPFNQLVTHCSSEQICQMFCDKLLDMEMALISEMYGDTREQLIKSVDIKKLSEQTGFTEQQIINSLEKLKSNDNTGAETDGSRRI